MSDSDLSDADNAALVRTAVEFFGRLDIAFNNAGIEGLITPTTDYPTEDWERMLAINLTGVFLGMRHQIARMREQRAGGAIVNIASILGLVGVAEMAACTAAKHGVVGLTKAAALENAQAGIRINAINAGFIEIPPRDGARCQGRRKQGGARRTRRAAPHGTTRACRRGRRSRPLVGVRRGVVRHGNDTRRR